MTINVIGRVYFGTSGADNLTGGSGNDMFHMTANDYVTDHIDGGAGIDTIDYSSATTRVKITLTDAINKAGSTGGTVEADFLKFNPTNSSHHQVVATLTNIENAIGSIFADTLIGNSASNVLNGGAGSDVINGGGGNDTIIAGLGADTLTGGDGGDTFVYNDYRDSGSTTVPLSGGGYTLINHGLDVITDFQYHQDRVDLSGINAQLPGGAHLHWIDTDEFTIDRFTGHAGEVQFVGPLTAGSDEYVQIRIDVDGDENADFYLNVVTDLSGSATFAHHSDFILV
jgi:Ca2+-binding RTX toxin-like protein